MSEPKPGQMSAASNSLGPIDPDHPRRHPDGVAIDPISGPPAARDRAAVLLEVAEAPDQNEEALGAGEQDVDDLILAERRRQHRVLCHS